jgi:hypothetical protein
MSFAFGQPSCGRGLRCIGAPNLGTCERALRLRCGRGLGRPSCKRALRCVGAPNLQMCLAFRWGAQLADVPCVAFGRPSCERTLRCIGAPNLGEAVLKCLPPSRNLLLSILLLVFLPSAPLCGHFRCVCVFRLGAHLANSPCVAFGCPSCGRALCYVGAPKLWTCGRSLRYRRELRLRCGRALGHPTCRRALRCVGVPNLRTCPLLCWGAQPW